MVIGTSILYNKTSVNLHLGLDMGRISSARLLFLALAAIAMIWVGCDELTTEVNNITVWDTTMAVECFECHTDTDNRLLVPMGQWKNSAHASSEFIEKMVMIDSVPFMTNDCGRTCHNNEGFVEFVKYTEGVSGADTSVVDQPSIISCYTCHKPHSAKYGWWSMDSIRYADTTVDYQLVNGMYYTDQTAPRVRKRGRSQMCTHCHQARQAPPQPDNSWEEIELEAAWGPHFSPQADVVSGTGGYQYELELDTVLHSSDLFTNQKYKHACLVCHFGEGAGYDFGEHTFRLENEETG